MNQENSNSLDVVSIRLKTDYQLYSEEKITSPESAVNIVGKELKEWDRECVAIINLQTDGRPINVCLTAVGTVNACLSRPAELLKCSILSNASFTVLLHNHPSGNVFPSKEDLKITERLSEAYSLMGIPMLDHVIVGRNPDFTLSYRSLKTDYPECFVDSGGRNLKEKEALYQHKMISARNGRKR